MIETRRLLAGGRVTRCLEVSGRNPDEVPVVFVHGNPSSADCWLPFLDRLDGRRRALAFDQIGFGRSERAPEVTHTMNALAQFLPDCLDAVGVERFDLVVHDWGTTGLIAAVQQPQRVGKVVVSNAVPLFDDYRWHWVARWFWRRPVAGELLNATTTRQAFEIVSRQATPRPGPPPGVVDEFWPYWDSGMRRAVLELYRSADPVELGRHGERLGELAGPSLVLWGDADPYIAPSFADRFGQALGARVEHLPDAGHWPWLDRPDAIDTIVDFLTS